MARERLSLLAGRNREPLTQAEVLRAVNTVLGLDNGVPVRFDAERRTTFRVTLDDGGLEFAEIVLGRDVYPGRSIVDPNSALSLSGACVHELTHYYRWRDKRELIDVELEHLDEALTSLEAISRYDEALSATDIKGLVADAIQRMNLFVEDRGALDGMDTAEK